jgi:group I intron endonuclease
VRWIVYETRCIVSGKIYVGVHRQDEDGFDGYLGSGKALARAIKKHGDENFERRTLDEFSTEAEAYAREAEIVTEEFCKRKDTYNMKPGGFGGGPLEHSAESIEKIRRARLGRKHSAEARENMRRAQNTPEARERSRQANLGKKRSPEARENMRRAQSTPEARERNRQAHLGKKRSPETREKMRRAQNTPEARERNRQSALRRWAKRRRHAP